MQNVSAPFQAYFTANREVGEPDMVAHNLTEMLNHCGEAIWRKESRFKGYIQVRNHAGLIVSEINLLGRKP